jgi:hypothetical protein
MEDQHYGRLLFEIQEKKKATNFKKQNLMEFTINHLVKLF